MGAGGLTRRPPAPRGASGRTSGLLETVNAPFVRAAETRGVPFWRRLVGHAAPNAAIPPVTLVGLSPGALVAGSVVTEQAPLPGDRPADPGALMAVAEPPAPLRVAAMPLGVKLSLGFAALFVLFVLFGHALTPHGFRETSLLHRLEPPGAPGYPLGTDARGRDVLARLVTGAQITVVVALVGTVIGALLGTLPGIVAARRGTTEAVIVAAVDVQASLPIMSPRSSCWRCSTTASSCSSSWSGGTACRSA